MSELHYVEYPVTFLLEVFTFFHVAMSKKQISSPTYKELSHLSASRSCSPLFTLYICQAFSHHIFIIFFKSSILVLFYIRSIFKVYLE